VHAIVGVDVLIARHGAGPARIDDHCRDIFLLLMVGGAPENDRVRFAGVVPEMHDHVGDFDVLVGERRRIRAQSGEITGDRRGHAHAGIGLDGVGAHHPLHEQVLEILSFHGQLAGTIEADGVAAVRLDEMSDLVIDQLGGLLVRHADEVLLVERVLGLADVSQISVTGLVPFRPDVLADVRIALHPVHVHGLGGGQALDALQAVVGRMILVGPHGHDLAVFRLDDGAAADPAVGALREGGGAAFFAVLRLRGGDFQFGIGAHHEAGACSGGGDKGGCLDEIPTRQLGLYAFHDSVLLLPFCQAA